MNVYAYTSTNPRAKGHQLGYDGAVMFPRDCKIGTLPIKIMTDENAGDKRAAWPTMQCSHDGAVASCNLCTPTTRDTHVYGWKASMLVGVQNRRVTSSSMQDYARPHMHVDDIVR